MRDDEAQVNDARQARREGYEKQYACTPAKRDENEAVPITPYV